MLPNPGGLFQQDPKHVSKLGAVSEKLQEFRNEQMDKASKPNRTTEGQ